jgi:hypothetical protein
VSASPLDLGDAAVDEMRALWIRLEADAMTDLRAFIMDPGDGLIPVRRAIARCARCPWVAIMSGDDDAELADFLHALLTEHIQDLHSGKRGTHE